MTQFTAHHMHADDDPPVFRVFLPHGIGYVEIRTGNVNGPTGYPVVAVEVVSDALDTPAQDGRTYEPFFNLGQNTIYMVGYPDKET
jgi:hypothetical protein